MGSACTSSTQSSTQLPDWLAGPASETISRANDVSKQSFNPYGAELTAGINPTQQLGIDTLTNNNGAWTGQFGQAQDALRTALGTPTSSSVGSPFIEAGAGISTVGQSMPYLLAGLNQNAGLGAASPFLSAASQTAPSALSSYMSPYTSGVVDEIARLGSRNLTENILPNINDTFIRGGQFGSDRNATTIGRAIRDTGADIAGKQASALEAGYGTAGQLFESDAARAAQLAGTAGGLGESAASRALQGGNIIGQLSAGDANRQITAGNALASLTQADQAAALANSRQAAALSGQQQQQTQADANALLAAGGVQQSTQQRADDAAYQQFLRQQNFPKDQLSWLNSIIRGTPYGQQTTSTTQQPLANWLFKDGGRVPRLTTDVSPLTAYGRRMLADGGYLDDEEDDDLLFPREGSALDAEEVTGPGLPGIPRDQGEDDGGADGEDDRDMQLADAGAAPASPLAAAATPAASAQPSALAALKARLLSRLDDSSEIQKASADVDRLQKSALEAGHREKDWLDSPLAQGAIGFLAAPKGTGLISRIGFAGENIQQNRRKDMAEERQTRMDTLKAAQQRLSNILNMRTTDTSALTGLARAEALQARANTPRPTTIQADAAAMGFNLATPEGRAQYQKFRQGLTREPQGGSYAPTDIEKWGAILKDPNADPLIKDAARRALGAKGNRDLTPAQAVQLRNRAAALAHADVAALGKDFQFPTPEAQAAYIKDRTDKNLAWLQSGADPDAAPAAEAPKMPAAPPAPAAPPPQGAAAPPVPAPEAPSPAPLPPAPPPAPAAAAPGSPTPRGDKIRDVPANMVTAMSNNAQGVRQIDKALAALEEYPDAVGLKAAALNAMPGPALDRLDPKGTTARALIADIGSLKIHDRSGAAVTAAEFPRLKPFVPNVYDDDKTVKKKLEQFRSAYMEILADQYSAYGPSSGHKANPRIEDVLKGAAKDAGAAPARPSDVPTNWNYGTVKGVPGWISPDKKKFRKDG